jgi:hypothetical protein
MAPTRSAPLSNHANRATDMAMAFHRLKMRKDRDWLDYATLLRDSRPAEACE